MNTLHTDASRLVERVLAEYREMPGLSLTERQAARFWGVEPAACVAALQTLVARGHLECSGGRYRTAGDLRCAWRAA